MNKLTDINALRKDFKVAERCFNCPQKIENCLVDKVFTHRDVCEILDKAPIIKAIPIDWLTKRINETAYSDNDNDIELNHALFWTSVEWERWNKEHEID